MKRRGGVWVCGLLLLGCHARVPANDPASAALAQAMLFEEGLDGVYLGMPLADFQGLRGQQDRIDESMGFRLEVVEERPSDALREVTWYFAAEIEGRPLYEAIMAYPEGEDVAEVALTRLGPPNSGEEWRFEGLASFPVLAWVFEDKLVVAGAMPGTEWAE